MDKIRALTVFRRVVELGSFKAAAEDLSLSKAAVSKNINELEDYLKSPLINRTTRNMHITDNGQLYYNQVCNILDDLKHADLSVIESSHTLKGSLKISVPMSLGILEINPIICEFMHQYPDLSIEVVMSDQYVDLIDSGIDIAIRGGGELSNSSLRSRKLIDMRRVLCASPEYLSKSSEILKPEDLAHHKCLIYSFSSSARRWLFRNEDEVKEIELQSSSYVVNNGLALKQTACSGHGILLLPDLFVKGELESGELVEVLSMWQADRHSLYVVYPFHKEQSQKVRTFIDFVVKHFENKQH
ncbi:LysR family transcriptional regulator [Vibrio sp. Vb2880]|uniref:LysR family transcriptional regulator n=1 Tax=Vibrio alginolyticus TaxID=663 RepID=A0AA36URW8_VIBAL|nr:MULTISPECIES: LysR family transcriptional regulator [Vibrio]MDK9730562.1 LysR family transcriptional regulator [Vibrio sp. D415a]MDK9748007.1 LysR family transcriptional regulator [Vibrio sp. D409a]MDK9766823.1 LysR family transcriptional regulator [Vibrio sp. D417a]MDK9787137.1 LysR family transcriptional regulator [Vibrio sp. D421a]MDW1809213.1 LysR family transcriptional regulator [Vibrio sp. Vb2362]NAW93578.1 LysR family transcriptional regulator [Vibrio sp. V42_P2S4T144]